MLRRSSSAAAAAAAADARDELEFGHSRRRSSSSDVEAAAEPHAVSGDDDDDDGAAPARGAVRDHPDFAFLAPAEAAARLPPGALPAQEPDARKWRVLEIRLRPDRAWDVVRELLVTVCMAKGLVVADEAPGSVLFRKRVSLEGGGGAAAVQLVFVRVGVLPSKLRALHVCCLVAAESRLLAALVPGKPRASGDWTQPLALQLDQLLGAVQAVVVDQRLALSHLFMATPENAVDDVEGAELDAGYVQDVRRMFASEMKTNMRDLCIPLEEFAYEQEFACALLISVLEPLYKKHGLKLADEPASASGHATLADALSSASLAGASDADAAAAGAADAALPKLPSATSAEKPTGGAKCYGEVVNDLVHALWKELTAECERKVTTKIDEKQRQVTARADAAQRLRVRAITTIVEHADAVVTSLKPPTTPSDKRPDVLLYEGSSVVNTIPSRLHVTLGALIYRTMVPLLATTTVIPFADVARVAQTTVFGIRVVSVELLDPAKKAVTITTGLEVDLLYQLLVQVFAMHQLERTRRAAQQQDAQDAALLQTLLRDEDGDEAKVADDDDGDDEETDVAFKHALAQSEAFS